MNDDIRELNDAELEAVTGAGWSRPFTKEMENQEQMEALKTFQSILEKAAGI